MPRVRQSRVRKGGCAPVYSLHILSSFDLICMLVSSKQEGSKPTRILSLIKCCIVWRGFRSILSQSKYMG